MICHVKNYTATLEAHLLVRPRLRRLFQVLHDPPLGAVAAADMSAIRLSAAGAGLCAAAKAAVEAAAIFGLRLRHVPRMQFRFLQPHCISAAAGPVLPGVRVLSQPLL